MLALIRRIVSARKLMSRGGRPYRLFCERLEGRDVPSGLVDQSILVNEGFFARFGPNFPILQSFKQAHDNITGASVQTHANGTGTGSVTISLYSAQPSAGGGLLASGTASNVTAGDLATVDFPFTPVIPDRTYFLLFTGSNGDMGVASTSNAAHPGVDLYPRGQGYHNNTPVFGNDVNFQTFYSPATDIEMQSAQLQSGNTVQFTYQTTGNPGPFEVGLYRSTDGITYNSADLLSTKSIVPDPRGGQGVDAFSIPPLSPDPDLPYLLVVADPDNSVIESDENNNAQALLVGDIEIVSATTLDSRSVSFTYTVTGRPSSSFEVGVYRSSRQGFTSSTFNPTTDVRLPLAQNINVTGPGTFDGVIASALPIDPEHPFVFVVADPLGQIGELSEDNNAKSFEKRVLGVVTHGYSPLAIFQSPRFSPQVGSPDRILGAADSLRTDQGYDRAVAFDWAKLSSLPIPGATLLAGGTMALRVASELALMRAVWPTAIFDVHFIGHSRGTVVISRALQTLQSIPLVSDWIHQGFTKMTMIDPHPAANFPNNPQYSVINDPTTRPLFNLGRAAERILIGMQSLMQDPMPFMPSFTDAGEVFFQHTPWYQAGTLAESVLNLWGLASVVNFSGVPIVPINLTGQTNHTTIVDWYLATILPNL